MMRKRCLTFLFIFLLAVPGWAGEFSGRCVGVTDGDTLRVMHAGKAERIRLYGIDAPELHQAFGEAAKKYASSLVFGKEVTVQVKDTDRYGRTVSWVILTGGEILNAKMVRAGYAWHYTQYSKDPRLAALLAATERLARREKKGLWADKTPWPPWEFRRTESGAAAAGEKGAKAKTQAKTSGKASIQTKASASGKVSAKSQPPPTPNPQPAFTPQPANPTWWDRMWGTFR